MDSRARSRFNTQIYEQACEWFVDCRAGDLDAAGRRAFDQWLRKSPDHLNAYLELAAIYDEGPTPEAVGKWQVDELVAAAARSHDNVVSLSEFSRVPRPSANPSATTYRRRLTIAASICAAAVLVMVVALLFPLHTFSTGTGEQRSIVLADGSTIELNSRSKVKISFSAQQRDVELLAGQALFRVAKDHTRPFVVSSGGTRVRAVGTQFDVYKKSTGTVVTVVEGRVAVLTEGTHGSAVSLSAEPAATAKPSLFVSAGEQVTVTPRAAQRTENPNIEGATAWRQRELVFETATLFEVAEEFNRYNEHQLVIDPNHTYDFHISGAFSSADPSALIRFLRARRDLRVVETASEIRVAPSDEPSNEINKRPRGN